MAFNLNDNAADELPEQHDINVTPFIDVMLVLDRKSTRLNSSH